MPRHPLLPWALVALMLLPVPARAHVPHDVTGLVAVSPDLPDDGLALGWFSLVDLKLFGRSTDGGRSWDMSGLPMAQYGITRFAFSPAFTADGTIYASSSGAGVFRSTDRGLTWEQQVAGLAQPNCTDLALSPFFASDATLIVSTRVGAYRSTDGGALFTAASTGLSESKLTAVAVSPDGPGGPVAFLGGLTVHRSTDLGQTWTPIQALGAPLTALAVSPDWASDATVVATTDGNGVFVSTDGGFTFVPANGTLTDLSAQDVTFTDDGGLLLANASSVFRASAPLGAWTEIADGLEPSDAQGSPRYRTLAPSPAFSSDGVVLLSSYEGCYRSDSGGASWLQQNVFAQTLVSHVAVSPDFTHDRLAFVASPGAGVLARRQPLTAPAPSSRAGGQAGAPGVPAGLLGGALAAGPVPPPTTGPIPGGAEPPGGFAEWRVRTDGLSSLWSDALVVSPDFAQDDTVFFGYLGVFRSQDRGRSWTKLPLNVAPGVIRDVAVSPAFGSDGTVLASTNDSGVWKSTDAGDSWTQLAGGLPTDARVRLVEFSPAFAGDQTVFAGGYDDGLFRSTDGGSTWSVVFTDPQSVNVQALAVSPGFGTDGTVIVAMRYAGVWRSQDGGDSWVEIDAGLPLAPRQLVQGIAFSPTFASDGLVVLALGDGSLFRSDEQGSSWTLLPPLPTGLVDDLVFSPDFADDRTLLVAAPPGLLTVDLGPAGTVTSLPVPVRTDDAHPDVVQSTGFVAQALTGATGLGVSTSTTAGAYQEATLLGHLFRVHAARGPDAPIVSIELDGTPVGTADLYAPQAATPGPVFSIELPETGWHTVRVTHSGMANAQASGALMRLDGFSSER